MPAGGPQPHDPRPVQNRTIVVGVIRNRRGEILLCRMAPDRGVFPGQWGLPGGGIESGERMEDALRRELREEVGLEVTDIEPILFKDGLYEKRLADGSRCDVYMIFLVFECLALDTQIALNDELSSFAWVSDRSALDYDLNVETRDTFERIARHRRGVDQRLQGGTTPSERA